MKAMQHALPHTTTYRLVSTYHTGGIANGVPCQNCGKLLSHVAIVVSAEGQQHHVGLDCASTLATLDPLEFTAAGESFALGKKILTALRGGAKKHGAQYGVAVYACNEAGTELVVQGHQLRVTGGASYRDTIFRHYVTPGVYQAVVKPLCGDLLPAGVQTLAERQADEKAWGAAFRAAFQHPSVRVGV